VRRLIVRVFALQADAHPTREKLFTGCCTSATFHVLRSRSGNVRELVFLLPRCAKQDTIRNVEGDFPAQGSPLFRAKPLIHSQGFLSAQLLLWRDGVSGVFLNKNGPETVIKIYGEEPENIENERTLERTEDRNQQDSDSNSEASIDCGSNGRASRRCHGSTPARGVGCSEAVGTPRLTPICESRGDEGLCCRLIQRLEARCDTADAHRKRPMGGQPHYHTRTSRISVCRRWPMGARSESARNRSQSVWRTQFGAGRFDVVDVPEYDPASCEEASQKENRFDAQWRVE
jgi:hypothetical protein